VNGVSSEEEGEGEEIDGRRGKEGIS